MSAAVVIAAALAVPASASAAGPPPFIAYTPGAYLTTPIPPGAVVAGDSAVGIAYAKAHDPSPFPLIRGVNGNLFGMVYAMGQCTDPIWRFPTTATLPGANGFLATQGFHAPASFGDQVTAANNNDQPIVVIDRCGVAARPAGFTVWGANVDYDGNAGRVLKTAPQAGPNIVGGAFAHDSNGLDRRNPASTSTVNERSRGVIPDSMVIRDDLLAYGIANGGDLGQVLEMFWVETKSASGFATPMVGAESGKNGYGAEGQRIRIRATVDLTTRGLTPAGLVVARTLQRYGAYLGDNSGSGSGMKAQQGSTQITKTALAGLTWDDFEFLAKGQ